MKSAHLDKIGKRAIRALDLLLPFENAQGEVEDPKDRLKQIITRVGVANRDELANDIWALTELLETDVPDMIQAVRDAQAETREARRSRMGDRYKVVISSNAPIKIEEEHSAEQEPEAAQVHEQGPH